MSDIAVMGQRGHIYSKTANITTWSISSSLVFRWLESEMKRATGIIESERRARNEGAQFA